MNILISQFNELTFEEKAEFLKGIELDSCHIVQLIDDNVTSGIVADCSIESKNKFVSGIDCDLLVELVNKQPGAMSIAIGLANTQDEDDFISELNVELLYAVFKYLIFNIDGLRKISDYSELANMVESIVDELGCDDSYLQKVFIGSGVYNGFNELMMLARKHKDIIPTVVLDELERIVGDNINRNI